MNIENRLEDDKGLVRKLGESAATGLVSGIAGDIGSTAVDAIFSALGIGASDPTPALLQQISSELTQLHTDLVAIQSELSAIEQTLLKGQHLETWQKQYEVYRAQRGSLMAWAATMNDHAVAFNEPWVKPATWRDQVLGTGQGDDSGTAQVILQDITEAFTDTTAFNLLDSYAAVLLDNHDPAKPDVTLRAMLLYIQEVGFSLWTGTMVERAAHVMIKDTVEAKDCVVRFIQGMTQLEAAGLTALLQVYAGMDVHDPDMGAAELWDAYPWWGPGPAPGGAAVATLRNAGTGWGQGFATFDAILYNLCPTDAWAPQGAAMPNKLVVWATYSTEVPSEVTHYHALDTATLDAMQCAAPSGKALEGALTGGAEIQSGLVTPHWGGPTGVWSYPSRGDLGGLPQNGPNFMGVRRFVFWTPESGAFKVLLSTPARPTLDTLAGVRSFDETFKSLETSGVQVAPSPSSKFVCVTQVVGSYGETPG